MKQDLTPKPRQAQSRVGLLIITALSASTLTSPAADGPSHIRLEPTLHFRAAHGNTSLPEEAATFGGHDPHQDGFNFQGFEIGGNLHVGEFVKGFATVNIFKADGEAFDAEFEEGFLAIVNLPGGFEIRGGRMLSRLGGQNANHLHAWNFADASLMNVRYLGDDGFAVEGGEITWMMPTPWEDALSIGFGSAVTHDHDHAHGDEEEDHDDHDDDDHDHDDAHGHSEEAEMARPEKNIVSVRYQALFGPSDFHQFRTGGSFLTGENGFGMTTRIYGADFSYTWRENGLEPGGRQFRWLNEWLMRDVQTDHGRFKDNGFSTALLFEFVEGWEAGLRYDYLQGVSDPELPERHRISPSVTHRFNWGNDFHGLVRLQWNHDDIQGRGKENSIWIQLGFDWGPGEVR